MGIGRFYIDCTKLVPTEVLNDKLLPVKTYVEASIKGYIGSGTNDIIRVADKDTIETRYKFLTSDFNLGIGDIIKYEDRTYEVISEPRNNAHRGHHIKAEVKRINNIKQQ